MTKEFKFEAAMKELEEITAWFERSDVDLDQSLAKFERGLELSSSLKDYLQTVENKVEKIKQKFDNSRPVASKASPADENDLTDLFA
jgi:exodeoxyribonuclease VII small subunit